MKFGINTFLFTSPFTNQSTRWFAQFKSWGFDGVEIAVENPGDFDANLVRAKLDQHGLSCLAVCACFPPTRDLRGTRAQQHSALKYLHALLPIADTLHADRIIGPFYSATGRADAVAPTERRRQWRTVVEHLRTICRAAEKRGKMLCVEPLNRFETDFLNTVDQGLELIDAVNSPSLKLLLDTFHMNIEEKNLPAAVRRAGRHLGHLHASGSDRGTPGNDHIDWKGISSALKAIRFDGPVVIESFTTDVQVIARAAAIWRKIEPDRNDIARKGVFFLKRTLK